MTASRDQAKQLIDAARYFNQLGKDIQGMLSYVENHLLTRSPRLFPLKRGRVAGLTDAFTEPETWYPIVLGRVYGALRKEGDSETKLKEIYVIEIHIAPDGFADEPVVLLAKVLLTEPGNRNEVWNSWNNEGEWLGKALEPGAASAEVDKEGAKEIWPNAERVVAKVIPLFDIRKEEDILPKLVKPFLKLIEQK